jgi:hypothetical protein
MGMSESGPAFCAQPDIRPPGIVAPVFAEQHGSTELTQGGITMADAGPPLVLMALGLILWLAVKATIAGLSIQTIGIILFLAGVVWLLIELVQARRPRTAVVRDEPVARRRDVY